MKTNKFIKDGNELKIIKEEVITSEGLVMEYNTLKNKRAIFLSKIKELDDMISEIERIAKDDNIELK